MEKTDPSPYREVRAGMMGETECCRRPLGVGGVIGRTWGIREGFLEEGAWERRPT